MNKSDKIRTLNLYFHIISMLQKPSTTENLAWDKIMSVNTPKWETISVWCQLFTHVVWESPFWPKVRQVWTEVTRIEYIPIAGYVIDLKFPIDESMWIYATQELVSLDVLYMSGDYRLRNNSINWWSIKTLSNDTLKRATWVLSNWVTIEYVDALIKHLENGKRAWISIPALKLNIDALTWAWIDTVSLSERLSIIERQ